MNVVALVSGGKDSCYSILQCQKHGHKVVALANLLPPDSTIDELDSYMYQTVGHQLVSAYATCTGLPLYRCRIQGHSRSQGLSYSTTAGDEVEDLLLLLAYIKEAHPDIQAVASGAIASDYQRLRVESVCSRLSLVSLGYLWHQPQEQLLADMIANDIEAVLVKVAALGLEPHKHLGKSIRQLQPHLHRLRDRFGCNVCGEGGEYETLTLDCPAFTQGRIVLDSWEVVLHSPDSIAAVGVLHPTAFHIEPKEGSTTDIALSSCAVTEVPLDWQPQATAQPSAQPQQQRSNDDAPVRSTQGWQTEIKVSVSQHHVHIICSAHSAPAADLHISQAHSSAAAAATGGAAAAGCVSPEDTAAALEAALLAVSSQLDALQGITSWQLSCFVHLYLADMSHFAVANAAYCKHLHQTNPPSRACVQVPLPPGCPVLLDVLFARQPVSSSNCSSADSASAPPQQHLPGQPAGQQQQQQQQQPQPDRRVLHVQSISDWAPSCIGPYSQATSCNGIIHMAGQIPLDPGSMNIITAASQPGQPEPTDSSSSSGSGHMAWAVAAQVWRTLCSCQAVAVAVKSCFASSCLGLTVYVTPEAEAAGAYTIVKAALQAVRRDRDLLAHPHQVPQQLVAAAAAAAAADTDSAAAQPASAVAGSANGQAGSGQNGCSMEGDSDDEQQEVFVDDYLRPPEVQEVLEPTVVYLTVPALPRGALLEAQPLLLDLSAVAGAASSSSSDHDGPAAQLPIRQPGSAAAAGSSMNGLQDLLQGAVLQHHHVKISVTQPSNDSWQRVLLQLQSGDGSSKEREAQIAAVRSWLSAYCSQGPCSATATSRLATEEADQCTAAGHVVSLRCWYDVRDDDTLDVARSQAQSLLSGLAPKLAGQVVPVLSAYMCTSHMGPCWCLVEIISGM